jgi:hypothetical protein
MSSPLAIAAVTAALKDLLNDGLLNHDLSSVGSFSVTALPPDRVSTGQNEPNQLNLFLYQVTPNIGWRNVGLPSRDGNGVRLSSTPLALDLHYLLTAYGSQDLNAEILLGYAMQLFHETPVLTRAQLRTVLGAPSPVNGLISPLPSPFGPLSAIDLADQIEMIKITPVYLGTEDLSKMWTAMQARYRTGMAYMASVVLIEVPNQGKAAPPVLKRGPDDAGNAATASAFPTLSRVQPNASELLPAMRLGDDLKLTGSHMDDPSSMLVVLENSKAGIIHKLVPTAGESPSELIVHVPSVTDNPDAINEWGIGLYSVALQVTRPNLPVSTSKPVYIVLAPLITVDPHEAVVGDVALTITCTPRLRPDQEASTRLIFGSRTIQADSIVTPNIPEAPDMQKPTTLTFTVPSVLEGEYMVRLRVEGNDSLPVTVSGSPPKLDVDPTQRVTVKVV